MGHPRTPAWPSRGARCLAAVAVLPGLRAAAHGEGLGASARARRAAATVHPECYMRYLPDEFNASFHAVGCPAACPYKSDCPHGKSTRLQCVAQEDCRWLQTGGRAIPGNVTNDTDGSGRCLTCDIANCQRCASSTACEVCRDQFTLQNNGKTCFYQRNNAWYGIVPTVVFIGIWFVVDLVRAHCQPAVNPRAVEAGLRQRFRTKVRNHGEKNHPAYPLWSTELHSKPYLGPDLALFMNWWVLVGIISAWLILLAAIFNPSNEVSSTAELCTRIGQAITPPGLRRRLTPLTDEYQMMEVPNIRAWTGLAYTGSAAITIAFFLFQQRCEKRIRSEGLEDSGGFTPMLHPYAVEVSGLPNDATDHAEIGDYLEEALKQLLGLPATDTVINVSVCYDFSAKRTEVEALVDWHLCETEKELAEAKAVVQAATGQMLEEAESRAALEGRSEGSGLTRGETQLLQSALGPSRASESDVGPQASSQPESASAAGAEEAVTQEKKPEIRPAPFWVQILGYIMLGTDFYWQPINMVVFGRKIALGPYVLQGARQPELTLNPAEAAEMLDGLDCAGYAVAVMKTTALREVLVSARKLPMLFRDKHRVTVMPLLEEPTSMNWPQYELNQNFPKRVMVGAGVMLLVLGIWTLLYIPWANFSTIAYEDSSLYGLVTNIFTGLIISIGNVIVAFTVVRITEYVGFQHESNMRLAQLLMIIPCVIINVVCDLTVTVVSARLKYDALLPDDATLRFNYATVLMEGSDIFWLLVPGYNLLPYLCEPIATVFLPLWVGIWRIKTDPTITLEQAERILVASPIELVNSPLCDIIVLPSAFIITFLFPSENHYLLFAGLFAFAVVVYFINRIRILRWQSAATFSTSTLNTCEMYLWSLPLALLAASFGGRFGSSWQQNVAFGWFSFSSHIAVHCVFVRYILPTFQGRPRVPRTKTYHDAAKGVYANYMNTNPIEVLRSNLCRSDLAAAATIATLPTLGGGASPPRPSSPTSLMTAGPRSAADLCGTEAEEADAHAGGEPKSVEGAADGSSHQHPRVHFGAAGEAQPQPDQPLPHHPDEQLDAVAGQDGPARMRADSSSRTLRDLMRAMLQAAQTSRPIAAASIRGTLASLAGRSRISLDSSEARRRRVSHYRLQQRLVMYHPGRIHLQPNQDNLLSADDYEGIEDAAMVLGFPMEELWHRLPQLSNQLGLAMQGRSLPVGAGLAAVRNIGQSVSVRASTRTVTTEQVPACPDPPVGGSSPAADARHPSPSPSSASSRPASIGAVITGHLKGALPSGLQGPRRDKE